MALQVLGHDECDLGNQGVAQSCVLGDGNDLLAARGVGKCSHERPAVVCGDE